jgi:hypothetical protein
MSLNTLIASLKGGQILVPVLRDYVAKENRKLTKGLLSKKTLAIHDAKMVIKAMHRRIDEFNHLPHLDGDYFHPSSIGSCMRMVWFSYFKAPATYSLKGDELCSYLILEAGSAIHIIIQNLCKKAGVMVKSEAPIQDEKNMTLGHSDGVLEIDDTRYILEIKTTNSRQFTLLGSKPKMAHVQQSHAYMKSLGMKWAIILYYDKDRSYLKEFVIPFDEEFYEQHCLNRIKKFFKHVKKKTVPEREGEFPSKFPCAWCGFADVCYSSDKLKKFVKGL